MNSGVKLVLNKKQIRQKRMGLLLREEDISKVCESCALKVNHNVAAEIDGTSKWNLGNCKESDCTYYFELLAIGKELENLSQQRKEAQMVISLTVERYKELKSKGKTDKQIITEFGYNNQVFNDWKRKHGLIKSRKENEKGEAEEATSVSVDTNKDFSKSQVQHSKPQTVLTEADLKKVFDELHRLQKFEKESISENEKLLTQNLQYEQAISELEQNAEHMRMSLEAALEEKEALEREIKSQANNGITEGYNRSQQLTLLLMKEVIELREKQIG